MEWYLYLFLLGAVLAVSLALILVNATRRQVPGARSLIMLNALVVLWDVISLLVLLTPSPELKRYWGSYLFLSSFVAGGLFIFSFRYLHPGQRPPLFMQVLLIVEPLATIGLALTDAYHPWMRQDVRVVMVGPGGLLQYKLGWWAWVDIFYSLSLYLLALIMIGRQVAHTPHLYRRQVSVVLAGLCLPLAAAGVFFSGLFPAYFGDLYIGLFLLSNLVLTWAIHNRGLSGAIAFSSASLLHSLTQGLIVVDQDLRILEVNSAACALTGKTKPWLEGKNIHAAGLNLAPAAFKKAAGEKAGWQDVKINGLELLVMVSAVFDRQAQAGEPDKPHGWLIQLNDFSERNALRRALEESEAKYRGLTDNALDGIVIAQKNTLIYCNRQAAALVGMKLEDVLGQDFRIFIPPAFAIELQSQYSSQAEPLLQSRIYETNLMRKDGLAVPVEVNINRILFKGENAVVAFIRDISVRKRTEQELRRLETRLRNFVSQSPDGFILLDERGTIIEWNPAMEKLSGLPHAEVIGKFYPDVAYRFAAQELRLPEKHEQARQLLVLALQTGEVGMLRSGGSEIQRPDGTRRYIQEEIFSIRTERGFQIGTTVRDVSEEHHAAVQLAQRDAHFRAILDNSLSLLWLKDPNGVYLVVNKMYAQVTGRTVAEIIGKNDWELYAAETAASFIETDGRVFAEGKQILFEEILPTPEGDLWVETTKSPIYGPAGELIGTVGRALDITARKRIEVELRESEYLVHTLADNSPLMIWMSDLELNWHYVNRAWLRFTGREAEEELGAGWQNGIPAEDCANIQSLCHLAHSARIGFSAEFRLRRADGEQRWIALNVAPQPDELGNLVGFIGYCSDRSEQKALEKLALDAELSSRASVYAQRQTEKALVDKNARLEAVFNTPLIGIGVLDDRGRYLTVNRRLAEMLGYSVEELLAKTNSQVTHPDDMPETRKLYRAMVKGEIPRYTQEKRYLRKDGSLMWGSLHTTPILEADGSSHTYIGFLLDISEQKAAAEKLRSSEELYRAIFTASPDDITITDLEGNIRMVSPAARRVFGYAEGAEPAYRNVKDFILPEDYEKFLQKGRALLSGGERVPSQRVRGLRADGSVFPLDIAADILRGADGEPEGLIFIARDVSEQLRMEEERQKQLRELEMLRAAMNELAAELDLNTLLHTMVARLVKLLGAVEGELALYDERENELVEVVCYNRDADYTGVKIQMGEGIMGKVAQDLRTLNIPDYAEWDGRSLKFSALHHAVLAAPLVAYGRLLGVAAVGSRPGAPAFQASDMRMIEMFAQEASVTIQNAQLYAEVQRLATQDPLTGVFNRRFFFERAQTELTRSERYQTDLALLVIDIDAFKTINDRFGHASGDDFLRLVARTCQAMLRDSDLVGRFGGEEFLLLLPEANAEGALSSAERLRQQIECARLADDQRGIHATISVGIATRRGRPISLEELFEEADRALYQAKQSGRNRVVVFSG